MVTPSTFSLAKVKTLQNIWGGGMYHTLHSSQLTLTLGHDVLHKAGSLVAEASVKILSLTAKQEFVPTRNTTFENDCLSVRCQ